MARLSAIYRLYIHMHQVYVPPPKSPLFIVTKEPDGN
jgi:hypothetical protein